MEDQQEQEQNQTIETCENQAVLQMEKEQLAETGAQMITERIEEESKKVEDEENQGHDSEHDALMCHEKQAKDQDNL